MALVPSVTQPALTRDMCAQRWRGSTSIGGAAARLRVWPFAGGGEGAVRVGVAGCSGLRAAKVQLHRRCAELGRGRACVVRRGGRCCAAG